MYWRKSVALQNIARGTLVTQAGKIQVRPLTSYPTKSSLKMDQDLNVRLETRKLLEESVAKMLSDIGRINFSLNKTLNYRQQERSIFLRSH